MKAIKVAVCTVLITGGAMSASVHAANSAELADCEEQVSSVYGDASEMNYVGERRFRDGTRMQYAVHKHDPATGYTTTTLAVCWLGNEDYQAAYNEPSSESMVADAEVEPGVSLETPIVPQQ